MSYIIIFITGLLLAIIFTPVSIILAQKYGIIDFPSERRIHSKPIPRLGGLAIYLSFWLTVLINIDLNNQLTGLLIGSTLMFLTGIIDDIKGLKPWQKLLGQLVSVIILVFFGLSIDQVTLPLFGKIELGIFGVFFAVFWVVGLINTVNISDGLDGLAAGICFIAALILFWSANRIDQYNESFLMLALAGAALGFLFFNFHPAKVFMGDSGSMLLGYIIGAVSIWGLLKTATVLGLVFPLLVLAMPLTDLLFAIVRRRWKGISVSIADRGHLHHRLLDAGLTQKQAVIILYGVSIMFGLAAVFCVNGNWIIAAGLVIINLALIFRIMIRRVKFMKIFLKKNE